MANQMKAVERISVQAERALAAESLAAQKAAASLSLHQKAANQNVPSLVKTHNTANLAAQGFDIVTTAAGGMSAGLIGMQQGLQVAQIAMTSTDGFAKTLAASFMAMLSPVTLLSVGLTALAALGIQQVNWSKLAASALTILAGSLQVIAPYAVGAAAALALLYAPALIGGVINLIALMGQLATSALGVAAAFAAANPAIAFVAGITAAVVAANIFRDELTNILGVDIVGAAKTGVNYIIGSFVGAFNDLKFVWAQFPNIIGAAAVGAANAAIGAIEKMINAATGMLNSLIQSVNGALGKLPGGFSIGEIGSVNFGQIDNPYAGALSQAAGDRNAALSSAMNTDYLGGFGSAISKGASMASSKLKELAKDLVDVDTKSKKGGKAGGGGKTEAEKYSDIVDGANRRIASLKAEQQAVGMTEEASAKLRYETELLNQAQQRGITLTAAQKAELGGLAGQMSSIEAATKKAKEALDFAKDATKGFLSDLRSGLANGEGFWKSFGKAANNVLDKIIGKIEDELVNALFSVSGAGAGGGGGFLGGIFGAIGKIFGFASGGYTGNGAANKAAGIVHGGEYVFSAKATKRIGVGNLESMHKAAKGYARGGSVSPIRPAANSNRQQPVQVVVQTRNTIDKDGNITTYVENVSQGVARQEVTQAAPKIVSTANQQVMPTVGRYQRDRSGGDYRNA